MPHALASSYSGLLPAIYSHDSSSLSKEEMKAYLSSFALFHSLFFPSSIINVVTVEQLFAAQPYAVCAGPSDGMLTGPIGRAQLDVKWCTHLNIL